jgi:hypothetical protein
VNFHARNVIMKHQTRALLIGLAILVPTWLARAADLDGLSFPDELNVEGQALHLNGVGPRRKSIFKVQVYVAALYLEHVSKDAAAILAADQPRRLELQLTHGASKARLSAELAEGIEHNAGPDRKLRLAQLARLLAELPDLHDGQRLSLSYLPGRGTTLTVGTWSSTVAEKDFADAWLRAYLGDDPLDSALKEQLLGRR